MSAAFSCSRCSPAFGREPDPSGPERNHGRNWRDRRRGRFHAEGVGVRIVNGATGFVSRGSVHQSRFLIIGLETGGPYSVTLRGIGFRPLLITVSTSPSDSDSPSTAASSLLPSSFPAGRACSAADACPERRLGVGRLRLGPPPSPHTQPRPLRLRAAEPARFDTVRRVRRRRQRSIRQLPDRWCRRAALHGRQPTGTAGGGKPISLEAVKEYQVLIAPYDVSLGNFAGGSSTESRGQGPTPIMAACSPPIAISRSPATCRCCAIRPTIRRRPAAGSAARS